MDLRQCLQWPGPERVFSSPSPTSAQSLLMLLLSLRTPSFHLCVVRAQDLLHDILFHFSLWYGVSSVLLRFVLEHTPIVLWVVSTLAGQCVEDWANTVN